METQYSAINCKYLDFGTVTEVFHRIKQRRLKEGLYNPVKHKKSFSTERGNQKHTDKVNSIFMTSNLSLGKRSKSIDNREEQSKTS